MTKVLVSDPIADKGISILEDAGFDIIYNPNPSDEELQALASDVTRWSGVMFQASQCVLILTFVWFSR